LADAAFEPNDPSPEYVYVTPVLVVPPVNCPYKAAARLRLQDNGVYSVDRLYGQDPGIAPSPSFGCFSLVPEPGKNYPREIEVDASGNVFVLSAHALNSNDWVLIYDKETGNTSEVAVPISSHVTDPAAMAVSPAFGRLYLTSSAGQANGLDSPLYQFAVTPGPEQGATGLAFERVITVSHPIPDAGDQGSGFTSQITSVVEDAQDAGRLYVLGFSAPKYDDDQTFADNSTMFTTPTLAALPPGATGPVAAARIPCQDVALPLSLVIGNVPGEAGPAADFDGDRDVDGNDVAIFESCASGPGVPRTAGCLGKDFDQDNDVDQADFSLIQRCYSGQDVPADANCGN
jgi:hypothetical protein